MIIFPANKWLWCLPAVAICLLLAVFSASASEIIRINKDDTKISLGKHVSIFEDKAQALTIDAIVAGAAAEKFSSSPRSVPTFGFTRSTFWLRFSMQNTTGAPLARAIENNWPHHDIIDFYLYRGGQRVREQHQVNLQPHRGWGKYVNPVLPVQ